MRHRDRPAARGDETALAVLQPVLVLALVTLLVRPRTPSVAVEQVLRDLILHLLECLDRKVERFKTENAHLGERFRMKL